ncbi:heterokaryon incompatibility protein-domain-containing protein [Xylogone sp. PMI_703]|nr:heterokaryon incompatibility protein-domain-containing protein [Xylogone sp. PMI_703]
MENHLVPSLSWAQVALSKPAHTARARLQNRPGTGHLCLKCSNIDFKDIFTPRPDSEFKRWNSYRRLGHIKQNMSCPFCRLVLRTIEAKDSDVRLLSGEFPWDTEISLSIVKSGRFVERATGSNVAVPQLEFNVLLDSLIKHTGLQLEGRIQMVSPSLVENEFDLVCLRGRRLETLVNVSLIKSFLQTCHQYHGDICQYGNKPLQNRFPSRVIDVKKYRIIDAPEDCKYVALSYVWGAQVRPQLKLLSSTREKLYGDGGVSLNETPTTVLDAIHISAELGERYLWVDALCIQQDDPDDLRRHFASMHIIYEYSQFTIVAAHGDNSWEGLCGVSKRKNKQVYETIGPVELANVLAEFPAAISPSIWNKRAWTMQEMIFAKKLIYFTGFQLYFQCGKELWSEDRFVGETSLSDLKPIPFRRGPGKFSIYLYKQGNIRANIGSYDKPFLSYCNLVNGYAKRAMTNHQDILNAFSGVLATVSDALRCEMIWGLPAAYMDQALLFDVNQSPLRCRHRPGFPTWSWTGWMEPRTNYNITGPDLYYTRPDIVTYWSDIEWYIINDNGDYVKIMNEKTPRAGEQHDFNELRARWRPRRLEMLAALPSSLKHSEWNQTLVFQTSYAFLKVELWDSGNYTVVSSDGKTRISTVECMHFSRNVKFKWMEFIVIAMQEGFKYMEERWQTVTGCLSLMMIETDERGISKRVDIAGEGVTVEEWMLHKPKWRTVFLV